MSRWPALLLNHMVTPGFELQLRAMTGFVALLQAGSVLMSDVPLVTEDYTDTKDQRPS